MAKTTKEHKPSCCVLESTFVTYLTKNPAYVKISEEKDNPIGENG